MTRKKLYTVMAKLGYEVGAEIGVLVGMNSKEICKAIPELKVLYCIDPWEAYPRRPDQEKLDGQYRSAVERLSNFPCTKIVKKKSLDAVNDFVDSELDFVYLDGDHTFENISQELIQWSRKVRCGGMVAGHDYCKHFKDSVVAAVDAYTKERGISFKVTEEKLGTFYWIKE